MSRVLLALVLGACVSGCGTRFAYENLDRFVRWSLDDYLSMDPAQKRFLDERLDRFLYWHRTHELPRYAASLRRLDAALADGASREELMWMEEEMTAWGDTLIAAVIPMAAEILYSTSSEQVLELEENLARENRRWVRPTLELSIDQRRKRWRREVSARVGDLVGRLSSVQKAVIEEASLRYRPDEEPWLAYRTAWQAELLRLLRDREGYTAFEIRFARLAEEREQFYRDEYATVLAHNERVYRDLTLALIASLDARQRAALSRRLIGFAEDFEQLAADAGPEPPLTCLVSCEPLETAGG